MASFPSVRETPTHSSSGVAMPFVRFQASSPIAILYLASHFRTATDGPPSTETFGSRAYTWPPAVSNGSSLEEPADLAVLTFGRGRLNFSVAVRKNALFAKACAIRPLDVGPAYRKRKANSVPRRFGSPGIQRVQPLR